MPKFRAWDKKEKSMWHARTLLLDQQVAWLVEFGEEGENEQAYPCSFENCHLMQSTGLKDKNGVEIFEGDIIYYLSVIRSKKDWYRKVVRRGSALVMMSFDEKEIDSAEYFNIMVGDKRLEVIGNIYENPELLEVEE